MGERFARAVELRIGDLEISNLSAQGIETDLLGIGFDIQKALGRELNKSQLRVINLSESARSTLSTDDPITMVLSAGYLGDNTSQLFQGDVRFSDIVNEGTDWITRFETGDGSKAFRTARINKSLKTAKPGDLLRECGDVLGAAGLNLGNLQDKVDEGGVVDGLNEFLGGVVLSGLAVDVMTTVVTGLGYEWSIQDGEIQILRPDETTSDDILVVTPDSGLIGSPQQGKKGVIKFRMLLDGRASPGRPIRLESLERPPGDMRIEKIAHIGDTWGNDWYTDVEAKETKKR